jgi:hypothetical protein
MARPEQDSTTVNDHRMGLGWKLLLIATAALTVVGSTLDRQTQIHIVMVSLVAVVLILAGWGLRDTLNYRLSGWRLRPHIRYTWAEV